MNRAVVFPQLFDWACRICFVLMAVAFASSASAEKGKLRERLTPEVMKVVYPPGAERLGPEEGSPPAGRALHYPRDAAVIFARALPQ